MHSTMIIMVRAIIVFSIATSVSAATTSPSSSSSSFSSGSSFSSLSEIKNELSPDEMIFFGREGRIQVIRRSEYATYTQGITIATAEQHYVNITNNTGGMRTDKTKQLYQRTAEEIDRDSEGLKMQKRCQQHQVFTMKPVESYVDWDIPMSGVLLAPSDSPASISVNEGFSIANSVSASVSANFALIKNFLKSTFDVSNTRSWTATSMGDYKFSVPPGKFGAIVINPITIRHSGHLDIGCIGQAKRTEFSSESYQSKKYSNMLWIEGLIGLCVGDTYPLKMCFGEGTL
ncbi:putative celp0028 effector like protein [Golovinomyces cichoracearum]|uniref:Putative celp0028 effector like protein n=1 Tax=Golovinomyces cichoracearum TaxID=62708 RepID=A0A420H9A7_9PEZI|nr:putative celp0028 effector like protein [Golovinomyces cichoracearum]